MPELRLHRSLDEIPAAAWDALYDGADPFVSHAFLDGLERTGCLRPRWGWTPLHAAWWDGNALRAAAPAYLKTNSHGEFVFDFAWAQAYAAHGLDYYPKWLVGVPYTPVPGPRLLARSPEDRRGLCAAMASEAQRRGWSSLHVNFLTPAQAADCPGDWLARCDVQFRWRNDAGWGGFDEFLAALNHRKRKNIRHERAQVTRAGVGFRIVHGEEAGEAELTAMHALYCAAFAEKGNSPALTLDFFRHLARALPRRLLLILAQRRGEILAGALCLRGADTLYGRYWGARETVPGLHFETCYYQGIEYCLREGLRAFVPGAQGEHKLARGFLPVLTHSRHWVARPEFAHALGRWCAAEREAAERYRDTALAHTPFRHDDLPALARR